MTTFHYAETPLPVGVPVRMNGSETSYELGLFDGAVHDEQYPDEPEFGVLFESPDAARRWLEAATAVLAPYIETGDLEPRIPDATGWSVWEGEAE